LSRSSPALSFFKMGIEDRAYLLLMIGWGRFVNASFNIDLTNIIFQFVSYIYKMSIDLLHFDTIYSTYVLPSNDPFNTRFNLAQPIVNAKKIYLKSIEMPINFCNVRAVSTMNKISLTTNLNNTYTVSVPEANYATIGSLTSALNTAFVGVIPSTTVTFATSGNYVTVSATSSTITSFSLNDTILSKYILGFRNATFAGLSTTATVNYLLNVDNFLSMYLSNVSTENTFNNGNIFTSFKISLQSVNGQICFNAENVGFTQSVLLLNKTQTISYLQIQIYDRFGNLILSNNSDYSFTLAVEYENSRINEM
jgi:hypothetical protein